jgi:hypothetical protein
VCSGLSPASRSPGDAGAGRGGRQRIGYGGRRERLGRPQRGHQRGTARRARALRGHGSGPGARARGRHGSSCRRHRRLRRPR